MGRTETVQYICDGCGAHRILGKHETTGYRRFTVTGGKEYWLCTICFGAVDWVVRFQRITIPPRVFRDADGRYSLREPR